MSPSELLSLCSSRHSPAAKKNERHHQGKSKFEFIISKGTCLSYQRWNVGPALTFLEPVKLLFNISVGIPHLIAFFVRSFANLNYDLVHLHARLLRDSQEGLARISTYMETCLALKATMFDAASKYNFFQSMSRVSTFISPVSRVTYFWRSVFQRFGSFCL